MTVTMDIESVVLSRPMLGWNPVTMDPQQPANIIRIAYSYKGISVPEPEQHGEPDDICVIVGGTGWAVRRRMFVAPFGLGAFNDLHDERGFNRTPHMNLWRNN